MKIKPEKFGFESMNFAIPVQCSTNLANIYTGFEPMMSTIPVQWSTNRAYIYTGFEPMMSTIPVQCSTNRANIYTGFEPMISTILAQRSTNWANMIFKYSLQGFITKQHYEKLPIGLLAQCRPEFFLLLLK